MVNPSAGGTASITTIDVRISKKTLQALAPLPDTAMRLLALLDDPDVPLREIANVAMRDVGISAIMLRMANSSLFGQRGRVGSISDALRVIGTAQARLLVLASGISQTAQKKLPQYGLAPGAFMAHSELVANLTMYVANEVRYANIGNAYSAGLLHDIGKIVINGVMQQHPGAASLEQEMRRRGCTLLEAEQAVCGHDHAALGYQLGELWALPADLAQAIAQHHTALAAPTPNQLAYCVALANAVAGQVSPGYPALNRVEEIPQATVVDIEKVFAVAEQFIGEAARSA